MDIREQHALRMANIATEREARLAGLAESSSDAGGTGGSSGVSGEIQGLLGQFAVAQDKLKSLSSSGARGAGIEQGRLLAVMTSIRNSIRESQISEAGLTGEITDLPDDIASALNRVRRFGDFRFAVGGSVPGSGLGDTVASMLTPGEFVIKKTSVEKYGTGFMNAINEGIFPRQKFAEGGEVKSQGGLININLSLNGQSGTGTLNPGSEGLIEELKAAGLTA